MSVDLSKAKKGDKVKFRCGGEAVIRSNDNYAAVPTITFEDSYGEITYDGLSGAYFAGEKHIFDIIAIESAPFDWSTVKAGMAFKQINGIKGIVYYVGRSINANSMGVYNPIFEWKGGPIFASHESNMTPAPEHDIEVSPCT